MMIKKIVLLLITLLIFNCTNKQDHYFIDASIDSSLNNKRAEIYRMDKRDKVIIDSAIVKNGKLTFKGKVDIIDAYVISIDSVKGHLPIILENTNFKIKLNKDSLNISKILGSKQNEITYIYKKQSKNLRKEFNKLNIRAKNPLVNRVEILKIQKSYDSLRKIATNFDIKFIKKHNDKAFSVFTLERLVFNRQISDDIAKELYDNLTLEMQNLKSSKAILEAINK